MVGLLNAPKNTKLYKRLEAEDKLTIEATGNNTDFSMNFVPRMNAHELVNGYKKIIHDISIYVIGLVNKGRRGYWKLLIWTLFRRPALVVDAVIFSIYGYHYRKVFGLTG